VRKEGSLLFLLSERSKEGEGAGDITRKNQKKKETLGDVLRPKPYVNETGGVEFGNKQKVVRGILIKRRSVVIRKKRHLRTRTAGRNGVVNKHHRGNHRLDSMIIPKKALQIFPNKNDRLIELTRGRGEEGQPETGKSLFLCEYRMNNASAR